MNTATRESMIDDAFTRLRQLAIDPSIPPETARRAAVDLIRLINHPPKSRTPAAKLAQFSEPLQPHRHQHIEPDESLADSLPSSCPSVRSSPTAAVSLRDLLIPDADEINRILDQVLGPEPAPDLPVPPQILASPPPSELPRRVRFKKRKKISR